MPELLKMGFEAKQRMIGAPPRLLGVVADPGFLLFAVDNDNHGVQVEDESASFVRQGEQMHPQTVVEPDDLANGFRGQTFEESSQSGLVRKLREPEHFQKGPVVLEDFGLVDAPHAHDDGEQQGQNEF